MDFLMELATRAVQYILSIGISDIIDILIIAFLVYQLLMLAKRTSTGGVLRGLALLLAALWISDIAKLNTLNFLLGTVVEVGLLALIVVFQPEIRRYLERMGQSSIMHILSRSNSNGTDLEVAIEQTVQAYTALSKEKTGALMVFERKNSLAEYVRSGTPMDATVNAELLKNLFWNKAPLHDGAVIIRNGRIVGAGCMLPLSGNVNLSRDLGMRHRAGIGVTEHSDAVVAIVSEETGSISVAAGGMLKRHLAPETLERLLRNELMPSTEETSKPAKVLSPITRLIGRKEGDKHDS